MELTKAQKFLVQWLKIIGCSEDETIGIIQMADTPSMLDELMDFMAENPDAVTPQDVLKKLAEILRKTNGERILVRCLKAIGVARDDTMNILLALDTAEKQDMLAEYLTDNMDATGQNVMRETICILKETGEGSGRKREFNGY